MIFTTNRGYTATLKFNSDSGMFKKKSGPVDEFLGEITYNDNPVCKIEGSWIDNISFDGDKYWELPKTSNFKNIMPVKCLPSDCRYREDSVEFGNGDLDLS